MLKRVLLCAVVLAACGRKATVGADAPQVKEAFTAPQDTLSDHSTPFVPQFEPDFNNLQPQPEVELATNEERDGVDVFPDRLEFPDTMTSVGEWTPGRLVVAAGSEGAGKNPLGFARRVTKVEHIADKWVVSTAVAKIEEVVEGDFQVQVTADNSHEVDLGMLDLEWAAQNLYDNGPGLTLPIQLQPTDTPRTEPLGLFDFIEDIVDNVVQAAVGTWDAIKKAGESLWKFITTGTFEGAVSYNPTFGFKQDSDEPLWPAKDSPAAALGMFSKTFKAKDGTQVKLGLDGTLSYRASAFFEPGIQVYGRFSVVQEPKVGVNIHSHAEIGVKFDMDVQASLESGGFKSLKSVNNAKTKAAGVIKNAVKSELFGADASTATPYKFILFVTKPQVKWIQAGPVPVAITMTMQFNLECSFQVQADIKTHADFIQQADFKFGAEYAPSQGGHITQEPTFDFKRTHEFKFERASGTIDAVCGVVPRVNVLLYDMIGAYAGVFGGVHAHGEYKDDCGKGARNEEGPPDGVVSGSLAARVAIILGAVVQPPGSSLLPAEKQKITQDDVLRKTVYDHEWKLYEASWTSAGGGLGWCPATCPNSVKDNDETDVDCGGSCGIKCALGQVCKKNSECETGICNKGFCSYDPCGDGVIDAFETDIDCGGPSNLCGACELGKRCRAGIDCASGVCSGTNETPPKVCVTNHCNNRVLDADEGGVDCSGALCGKCQNGQRAKSAADCESGFFNGSVCVGASCDDLIKNGDETDVDCGGSCPRKCGFLQGCATVADCSSTNSDCRELSLRSPNPTPPKLCVHKDGYQCAPAYLVVGSAGESCASHVCTPDSMYGYCASPSCSDGAKNGNEPDIDCGNPATTGCEYRCLCGRLCNTSADCDSTIAGCGTCSPDGVCGGSATMCSNGFLDAHEADVDCGGVCHDRCRLFKRCGSNADCELGRCSVDHTCILPPGALIGAWGFHDDESSSIGPDFGSIDFVNGVSEGGYDPETHVPGIYGSGVFDGLGAYADLPVSPPLPLDDKFSFTLWIKPGAHTGTIVGNEDRTGNPVAHDGFTFFLDNDNDFGMRLRLFTADTGSGANIQTAYGVVSPDEWHHIALTVDRSVSPAKALFYVDGVVAPAQGGGAVVESFPQVRQMRIGNQYGGDLPLMGLVEDFRLYHSTLTPAQIVALAQQ